MKHLKYAFQNTLRTWLSALIVVVLLNAGPAFAQEQEQDKPAPQNEQAQLSEQSQTPAQDPKIDPAKVQDTLLQKPRIQEKEAVTLNDPKAAHQEAILAYKMAKQSLLDALAVDDPKAIKQAQSTLDLALQNVAKSALALEALRETGPQTPNGDTPMEPAKKSIPIDLDKVKS
ncbi:MAG TPA: hypothetical protein ENJ42_01975, partial [Hellea balneolensis]|nr:hypothetical protein [Hellea balneolensis]